MLLWLFFDSALIQLLHSMLQRQGVPSQSLPHIYLFFKAWSISKGLKTDKSLWYDSPPWKMEPSTSLYHQKKKNIDTSSTGKWIILLHKISIFPDEQCSSIISQGNKVLHQGGTGLVLHRLETRSYFHVCPQWTWLQEPVFGICVLWTKAGPQGSMKGYYRDNQMINSWQA